MQNGWAQTHGKCFRSCYQMVINTDGGKDIWWFFTFANRSNDTMKNILAGKPTPIKMWRER